jgi:tryptophanyl-tRNA synthetase
MKAAGLPSRPVFTEPEPIIMTSATARIMSLTDGTRKMSKSDADDGSRINVLDPPNVIRDKIKRCKTDALEGIEWDNPERPEATNLLNIYAAVSMQGQQGQQQPLSKEDIMEQVKDMNWGTFKPILAEAVVNHLEPIQRRYYEVREDEETLTQILKEGAASANDVASRTLHATKVAMGFVTPQ